MEFTPLILAVAGSFGSLASQELNAEARKAQECPLVAKGKGYAIYAIPQDGGLALVHLENQIGRMRKIFAPSTSEYHDPFRGMPIHYRYTTTLSAMAMDEQRLYVLTATSTEDLSRGRFGRGFALGKLPWKEDSSLKLPGKGPLTVTKSGLTVKNELDVNSLRNTYHLQIYWRQDGRLIYQNETSGGEYSIDGKSVKKKAPAKTGRK